MSDDEFIAAFEAAAISRDDWTHEAHVRMGWIYVTGEPDLASATDKARSGIRKLNAANGVPPELYHETVTCAFMALIAARVGDGDGDPCRVGAVPWSGDPDTTEGSGARFAVETAAGSGAPAATNDGSTNNGEWEAFREAYPELLSKEEPILLRHYDKATLETDAARVGFVEPERGF